MQRRSFLLLAAALPALASGCGWTPLYADPESGPADADLRAIHVAPISERIGQKLELVLRNSLNPQGIPTQQHYLLRTTLQTVLGNLGVQSQGLATRGKLDVIATIVLSDIMTNKPLLTNTIHVADSFDLQANGYATVVAEDDARTRSVEELRREIVARLTMYMQRRRAQTAALR